MFTDRENHKDLKCLKTALILLFIFTLLLSASFSVHYFSHSRSGTITRIEQSTERIVQLSTRLSLIDNLSKMVAKVSETVVYVEGTDGYYNWSGSGVVVCPNGVILTAGHVVENAMEIKVTIGDKEYEAIDFYESDITDCGVILIDANDLSFASLGDSDKLKQGQSVFLIGSPYGIELLNSVTLGIISGLDRNIPFFGDKLILQSDAASNFGNSGGPLFNMDGEVVGVLVGGVWGADGIAFIIPSNVCKKVLSVFKSQKELEGVK